MCYGIGCRFEDHMGECTKKRDDKCPETEVYCDNCQEFMGHDEDDLIEVIHVDTRQIFFVCETCADGQFFRRVL